MSRTNPHLDAADTVWSWKYLTTSTDELQTHFKPSLCPVSPDDAWKEKTSSGDGFGPGFVANSENLTEEDVTVKLNLV